jgi:hypothetical protein
MAYPITAHIHRDVRQGLLGAVVHALGVRLLLINVTSTMAITNSRRALA